MTFHKGNKLGIKFNPNEKHPKWKGDGVSYRGLHAWVNKHKPKPDYCEFCDIKPHHDLSNITGIYNRDFENWKYLCVSCHQKYDLTKGVIRSRDMSGKNNPFFGRKLSEEHKHKIRLGVLRHHHQ